MTQLSDRLVQIDQTKIVFLMANTSAPLIAEPNSRMYLSLIMSQAGRLFFFMEGQTLLIQRAV